MDTLEKLSKHMLVDGFPLILDMEKSQGCRIYDKKTDKTFLDFFSFFASNPVGMNHPEMVSKEFINKLGIIAVNKPSCSDFYTDEMGDFVETFSRVGIPDFLPNLFMISGGALAVENALKAAFDWKVRKNFAKGIEEEVGSKVIHFEQAFHGRSGYTLSLTNTYDPRKTKYFPKFKDWPRVISPKITFPLEENFETVMQLEAKSCHQIHDAIEKYGDDIA
ncbi:MAG: aminotransferase class III-fold pyridoxal phosphate-dependent enzyme, partial [Candidatus Heimdallarchaeota archaeon]|nr:aminotransferase class III-fold pyridoxal phosphate-dependent enzyme [Candidatus Heimdallarchaeota archaeon]